MVNINNVFKLQAISNLDEEADEVLKQSIGKLSKMVIVGYDLYGNDFYHSTANGATEAIYLLERAKHRLLKQVDDMLL